MSGRLDLVLLAHDGVAPAELAARLADRLSMRVGWTTPAQGARPARLALPLLLHEGVHRQCDAPRLAAACGARLLPAPAPTAVARIAADAAEQAVGRRAAVLFVLRDWIAGERLAAALYPVSRRFTQPALAAFDAPPNPAEVLAVLREDGARRVFVQPIVVAGAQARARLARAADEVGIEVEIGDGLGAHEAFAEHLVEIVTEED